MEGGLDTVVGHQVNDEGFFVPDFSAHIATESVRCVYVRRAEYVKARDGVRQDEVSARNDLDELCSLSQGAAAARETLSIGQSSSHCPLTRLSHPHYRDS